MSNVGTDKEFLDRIKQTLLPQNQDVPYLAELTSPIIMTHTGLNAIGVVTLQEKAVR